MAVFLLNSKSRRPVEKLAPTPTRLGSAQAAAATAGQPLSTGLALPHERDESGAAMAMASEAVLTQAKRDTDADMVETDMRAEPGLNAKLTAKVVTSPGGRSPSSAA